MRGWFQNARGKKLYRFAHMRPRLPRSSAVCLSAAVSSFLLLFERIPWWDVPTHLAANGLLAVLIARVLRPAGPSVAAIVRCGVAAAVVWEGMELAG